jgi:hypothetical protein
MRIARSTRTLPALATAAGRLAGVLVAYLCAHRRPRGHPRQRGNPPAIPWPDDPIDPLLLDSIDRTPPRWVLHHDQAVVDVVTVDRAAVVAGVRDTFQSVVLADAVAALLERERVACPGGEVCGRPTP